MSPEFSYKARDKKGSITQGTIHEVDEQAVFQLLKKKGLSPIIIHQPQGFIKKPIILFERMTLVDRINFTKQLAVMMRAGLPIVDALETIYGQTTKKRVKQTIQRVTQKVKTGSALSKALAQEPDFFSELYVAMVESGEKSGQLEDILERLGGNLEKDHEITSKVKGALYYPAFILIVMAIVMFLIFTYVLPQLKTIFTDVGVELPLMTKILLAIGDFFSNFRYYIIIFVGLVVFGLKFGMKTKPFKRAWDIIQLKIPVFGPFYAEVYNERFARTLSSLVAAGLPMLDILRTCQRVMINHLYEEVIDKIVNEVESGTALSDSLKQQDRFPQVVGNMVAIGEKTGNIPKVVGELSNFYQREIDQAARNFTTLIEPFIMVVIGIGVGFMVAAVIVPIYNLISAA